MEDKHIIAPVSGLFLSEVHLLEVNTPLIQGQLQFLENLHDGCSCCIVVVSEVLLVEIGVLCCLLDIFLWLGL